MNSGRRVRVMIACVTFETVKISEPTNFYHIDRAHLIHYVKNPQSEIGTIYQQFYDRTVELIKKDNQSIKIIEHQADVNDFPTMLRTMLSIMDEEYGGEDSADIFINTSAGSSEYVSASTMASMMYPASIPFAVKTKHFQTEGIVKKIFFKDDVPIGQTKETELPRALPKYNIELPNRNLVLGLRILNEIRNRGKSTKSPIIIDCLKKNDVWFSHIIKETDDKTKLRIESVYYYRDFVAKWLAAGWVTQDNYGHRYILTDLGKMIIGTFYCDESLRF